MGSIETPKLKDFLSVLGGRRATRDLHRRKKVTNLRSRLAMLVWTPAETDARTACFLVCYNR